MSEDRAQKRVALLPPWHKHGIKYVREDPFDGERDTYIRCRTVTLRRARYNHLCFGLGGQQDHGIQAGDLYRHERANVDGKWGEYKMCLACMDAYIDGAY